MVGAHSGAGVSGRACRSHEHRPRRWGQGGRWVCAPWGSGLPWAGRWPSAPDTDRAALSLPTPGGRLRSSALNEGKVRPGCPQGSRPRPAGHPRPEVQNLLVRAKFCSALDPPETAHTCVCSTPTQSPRCGGGSPLLPSQPVRGGGPLPLPRCGPSITLGSSMTPWQTRSVIFLLN